MAKVMTAGLLLQFLLGMYMNLYGVLPGPMIFSGARGGMAFMVTAGTTNPLFMVHMILGALLALGALGILFMTVSHAQGPHRMSAVLGLVAVLIAGYGGLTFYMGGQHNGESILMAVSWLGAFISYWGLSAKGHE